MTYNSVTQSYQYHVIKQGGGKKSNTTRGGTYNFSYYIDDNETYNNPNLHPSKKIRMN